MKNKLWTVAALSVALLTACDTTPELRKREGFLTNYDLIQKEDDATFRYTDTIALGSVKQFILSPVKVTVQEFEGKPTTYEQRQAVSDFVRETMVKTLGDKYPFVTQSSPGTAEIRVAITDVYRKSGRIGVSLEGEVLDDTGVQVHAVVGSALSDKAYLGEWNNAPVFKNMIEGMATTFRQRLDAASAKAAN